MGAEREMAVSADWSASVRTGRSREALAPAPALPDVTTETAKLVRTLEGVRPREVAAVPRTHFTQDGVRPRFVARYGISVLPATAPDRDPIYDRHVLNRRRQTLAVRQPRPWTTAATS